MHCYQNCNKQSCIHYLKFHSLAIHYYKYFPQDLNRSRNRRHPGCIFLYCIPRCKSHCLTSRISNQCYRLYRSLHDHIRIRHYFNYHRRYHLQAIQIVIRLLGNLTNSHYRIQNKRREFQLVQRSVALCQNINRAYHILNLRSHHLEKCQITPYCKSYLVDDNSIPLSS